MAATKIVATQTQQTSSRHDTYYATQTEVLQALDTLRARVLHHGAQATDRQYNWGYIGDLNHILTHLNELLHDDDH